MSIQSSVGEPLRIAEKLPLGLSMPAMTASSVVQGRTRSRVVPVGAQRYDQSGPSQMTINLQDSANYIDPASICLNGNLDITVDNNGRLDEGIWSLIERARIYVNGTLIEDVNRAGTVINAEVLTSVPYGHYESALLPQALMYKYNKAFMADISGASLFKNQPTSRKVQVSTYQTTNPSFSCPLSYIFSVFRVPTFLPLRNMGQISMVFDFASVAQAFVADSGSASIAWVMSNVECEYDALAIDARYISVIDALTQDPAQAGYILPHAAKQVLQATMSSAGQKTLQFPIAKKHLRNVRMVQQLTADVGSLTKCSTSAFAPSGFSSAYVQVGSARFPQNPCNSYAKAYNLLLDSHSQLGNVLAQPIPDFENYRGTALGAVAVDNNADLFVLGFNFDRLRNEDISHDGIDTGSNGGQVITYLDSSVATATTLTATFEFSQTLSIRGGAVSVMA